MKRRQFMALLGAAAAWPLAARAQQRAVIGFLVAASLDQNRLAAFRRGLAEQGQSEGPNLTIDPLFADGRYERLPALVAEFVRRRVSVIFAGGNQAALAVKAANITTPTVFAIGDDPVRLGLVASLNKPGGNMTGITFYTIALIGKRLEILDALVPQGAAVAMLANPATPSYEAQLAEVRLAGRSLRRRVEYFNTGTPADLDSAFAAIDERKISGLFYSTDPFFASHRKKLIELAARHRLPAIYSNIENAALGGLMAYGASIPDSYHQAGNYVGRVLKGERPGDLPVTRPTRFELTLNLKTAKALGITFPPKLLALADAVIE